MKSGGSCRMLLIMEAGDRVPREHPRGARRSGIRRRGRYRKPVLWPRIKKALSERRTIVKSSRQLEERQLQAKQRLPRADEIAFIRAGGPQL